MPRFSSEKFKLGHYQIPDAAEDARFRRDAGAIRGFRGRLRKRRRKVGMYFGSLASTALQRRPFGVLLEADSR